MARLVYGNPRQYNHTCRYSPYRTIINIDTSTTYLESPNEYKYVKNANEIYHIVEPTEEGRLDMISTIYYGMPDLYWVIANANNIIDPLTVISGTVLLIPDISTLYSPGGVLYK